MNRFQVIHKRWLDIINAECVHERCKKIHINSVPFKLSSNVLQILIEQDKISRNYEEYNLLQISKSVKAITGIDIKCEYKPLRYRFEIKREWLKESITFAMYVLSSMTQYDFQNQNTKKRSAEDFVIDVVEGKLSEFVFNAFFNLLTDYNFEVDTRIYEGTTVTDGGNDVQIIYDTENNRWLSNLKVDIKSSKMRAQWLLVEETKALADVYVKIKMQFEDERFIPKGIIENQKLASDSSNKYKEKLIDELLDRFSGNYYGEIAGFAYITDIIDPITKYPWFKFEHGRNLIKVSEVNEIITHDPKLNETLMKNYNDVLRKYPVDLKAKSNFGIPIDFLRNSLEEWLSLTNKISMVMIPYDNQIYVNRIPLLKDRSKKAINRRKIIVEQKLKRRFMNKN